MGSILDCFVCFGCNKKNEFLDNKQIVRAGKVGNLVYITTSSTEKNLFVPILSDDNLFAKIVEKDFKIDVPKFGKYEIEEFIAAELKEAIFSSNNLDYLFNTSIICDNIYFTAEKIKEILTKSLLVEEVSSGNVKKYRLNI